MIDVSIEFTIVILGWILPDNHSLYKTFFHSVRNVTLPELLKGIPTLNLFCRLNIQRKSFHMQSLATLTWMVLILTTHFQGSCTKVLWIALCYKILIDCVLIAKHIKDPRKLRGRLCTLMLHCQQQKRLIQTIKEQ